MKSDENNELLPTIILYMYMILNNYTFSFVLSVTKNFNL